MCSPNDPKRIDSTFAFLKNGKAQNKDWLFFYTGLSENGASRRKLADFTFDNFSLVRAHLNNVG